MPVSRLKRVDLPQFGGPISATVRMRGVAPGGVGIFSSIDGSMTAVTWQLMQPRLSQLENYPLCLKSREERWVWRFRCEAQPQPRQYDRRADRRLERGVEFQHWCREGTQGGQGNGSPRLADRRVPPRLRCLLSRHSEPEHPSNHISDQVGPLYYTTSRGSSPDFNVRDAHERILGRGKSWCARKDSNLRPTGS